MCVCICVAVDFVFWRFFAEQNHFNASELLFNILLMVIKYSCLVKLNVCYTRSMSCLLFLVSFGKKCHNKVKTYIIGKYKADLLSRRMHRPNIFYSSCIISSCNNA